MKKYKQFMILFLSFCMIGMLTGCQKTENEVIEKRNRKVEDNRKEKSKELIVVNMDSATGENVLGNVLLNRSRFWGGLVFQGLLVADENISNVRKDLCEEYTISADGKTYVFVLQDDLYWQDGEKLTAEDVVWTIETGLLLQEVNGYILKGLQGIVGADMFVSGQQESLTGVSVKENKITIQITQQDNSFLTSIAQLPILPKHCLKDIPLEEFGNCEFWKMPVGCGPYKVIENKDNKEAVLVINENYSGKTPQIERIRYKILDHLEKENFTFAMTSNPEVIERYKNNSDYEIIKTGNLNYCYLYFNLDGRKEEDANRIRNKTIRQALAKGIDKENIIVKIYKGTATTMDSGIPSTDSWYLEKDAGKNAYNPELAKQMLRQAGFDFEKPLILTQYSQDELSKQLLKEIAKNWEQLGIKVEIQTISPADTSKLWVEPDWYDIGLKNLAAVDYSDWYYEYSSENPLWSKVYKNRTIFDVLIIALKRTRWAYERTMLYHEIQSMEADEMYKIPLAIIPQYVIYNRKELYIPNMELPNMEYYFDLNISQWIMRTN